MTNKYVYLILWEFRSLATSWSRANKSSTTTIQLCVLRAIKSLFFCQIVFSLISAFNQQTRIMPASFYILQSILIRGFAVHPAALEDSEFFRPIPPAIGRNVQLISTYHDQEYREQSSLIDSEVVLTEYPVHPAIVSDYQQDLTPHSFSKRNCHVIKCPKFMQTTFGTDGKKCYEFANSCFLALISCMRHNAQLPRKRVDRNHIEII